MKKIFFVLMVGITFFITNNTFAMDLDDEIRTSSRSTFTGYSYSNLDPRTWSSRTKFLVGGAACAIAACSVFANADQDTHSISRNLQCIPEIDFKTFENLNNLFFGAPRVLLPSELLEQAGAHVGGDRSDMDGTFINTLPSGAATFSLYDGQYQLSLLEHFQNNTHLICRYFGTFMRQCWGGDYTIDLTFKTK